MLSSRDGTSMWYNTKTTNVSFCKPEAGEDLDPSADGSEPADGGDMLIRAAQRVAEEVHRFLLRTN